MTECTQCGGLGTLPPTPHIMANLEDGSDQKCRACDGQGMAIQDLDDALRELSLQEEVADDLRAELQFMLTKLEEVLWCVRRINPGIEERMRSAIDSDVRSEISGTRRRNSFLNELAQSIMADHSTQQPTD